MNKPVFKLLLWVVIMTIGSGCSGKDNKLSSGIIEGRLADCPSSPNCVSTQSSDPEKMMPVLPYAGDLQIAKQKILNIINSLPRTQIVQDEANYLHVTFRSALFRFVDDVEFFFDETAKIIHFRSASRTGYSDFGVNRKRMVMISERYHKE